MGKNLEQFEKQWENNHPIYDTGDDTIREYNVAKEYWKAALKWVVDIPSYDIADSIYEELGEE